MSTRFPILNGVLQSNLDCGGYLLNNAVIGSSGVSGGVVTSYNGSTGAVTGVSSFNGSTGAVTGVASVNGSTGAVTVVSSFNGLTGAVSGVSSVNGGTGAVTIVAGVSSVNGSTGAVTVDAGVASVNGATGAVTFGYVSSFNGSTGAVTGVSSVNGSTGAVTGLVSYAAYSVGYSAGLTSDAGSMALLSQVSMSMTGGNLTLNPPSSPQSMQRIIYLLTASGAARSITVNSSIKSPTGSTFSGTCASGSTRYLELTYIADRWALTSNLEFTA